MRNAPRRPGGTKSPAPGRRVRWLLVGALLVLSPVCAEYLVGYDDSTGRPGALLANLVIFVPLYGAPAVLLRETARRTGMRWPGIVALAGALGVVQAGILDQSLFSTSYRQIDYWAELTGPTWIGALGLGAYPAVSFLAGHLIWSFCVPIAVTEAARPDLAGRPWLGVPGLALMGVLYAGAGWIVLDHHLRTEADHASAGQVAGAATAAALLAVFAFTRGRGAAAPRDRRVPRPAWLLALGLVVGAAVVLADTGWWGTAATCAVLAAGGAAVVRCSSSGGWTGGHVVALCTGLLAARAGAGFLIDPIGAVPPAARYAHNTTAVAASLLLGRWLAGRAARAAGGAHMNGVRRGYRAAERPRR